MAIPCYSREIAAQLVHMLIAGEPDKALRRYLARRGVDQSQWRMYIDVARSNQIENRSGRHCTFVRDGSRGFKRFIDRMLLRKEHPMWMLIYMLLAFSLGMISWVCMLHDQTVIASVLSCGGIVMCVLFAIELGKEE